MSWGKAPERNPTTIAITTMTTTTRSNKFTPESMDEPAPMPEPAQFVRWCPPGRTAFS